jgi:hypothetical protein
VRARESAGALAVLSERFRFGDAVVLRTIAGLTRHRKHDIPFFQEKEPC